MKKLFKNLKEKRIRKDYIKNYTKRVKFVDMGNPIVGAILPVSPKSEFINKYFESKREEPNNAQNGD